jgi:curved DNA-binding protein CbpA
MPPPAPSAGADGKDLTLYQLLQVDRDAHATIIRYAYRFLAAMYHPDNGETGDAEKFRVITEAWKTLSDDGKRAAYDMSLGLQEASQGKTAQAAKPKLNEFGRDALPNIPKTGITWNEIELRLGILQILLAARKKRPQSGGASGKMLMDCLNMDNIAEIEFALWYLREKGWIESGERVFMITAKGVDYLTDELGKTQVLGDVSNVEKKVGKIVSGGLPAPIGR